MVRTIIIPPNYKHEVGEILSDIDMEDLFGYWFDGMDYYPDTDKLVFDFESEIELYKRSECRTCKISYNENDIDEVGHFIGSAEILESRETTLDDIDKLEKIPEKYIEYNMTKVGRYFNKVND